jgi:hypothetical protein
MAANEVVAEQGDAMKVVTSLMLAAVAGAVCSAPVAAQPMGSLRWQLQPYCNVITLAVVQQGGQYQLDGIDNQCGAAQAASVRGMAFLNPNGTIGFGLTIVTAPGGTPVHVDATLGLPSLNGTWRDSSGNVGNFIFGAGIPGGGPRPVLPGGLAPGSVTTIQIAPAAVTNALIAPGAVTGASIADGSVTTADLATPPLSVGTAAELSSVLLTTSNATYRTVTLSIPSPGTVIVNATGLFGFGNLNTVDAAYCSITTGDTTEESNYLVAEEASSVGIRWVSFGGTRFFAVAPGTFTVRLVCRTYMGSATLLSPALNALFIPS